MNINTTIRFVRCAALLFAAQFLAAAQDSFTDAEADGIKAFLHDNFRQTNACMVIGLADQRGNRIFSAGKLDNGTDRAVDGGTVFFIGSVSKTFTALLLQDAVERGEMKLDDPVAKYLPTSIKMPTQPGFADEGNALGSLQRFTRPFRHARFRCLWTHRHGLGGPGSVSTARDG